MTIISVTRLRVIARFWLETTPTPKIKSKRWSKLLEILYITFKTWIVLSQSKKSLRQDAKWISLILWCVLHIFTLLIFHNRFSSCNFFNRHYLMITNSIFLCGLYFLVMPPQDSFILFLFSIFNVTLNLKQITTWTFSLSVSKSKAEPWTNMQFLLGIYHSKSKYNLACTNLGLALLF